MQGSTDPVTVSHNARETGAPMPTTLLMLKRGIVVFWTLWFTLALASNLFDALKEMRVLPKRWPFASGNYGLIEWVKGRFATPSWMGAVMFAGVIVWEAAASLLFWRAALRYRDGHDIAPVDEAFATSIGLWSAFLVADELFVAY